MNLLQVAVLMGGYYAGGGIGHPTVTLAVNVQTTNVSFTHATILVRDDGQRFADLFAYNGRLAVGHKAYGFVGAGYSVWRVWAVNPIRYFRGLGSVVGAGIKSGAMRAELRFHQYHFDSPTGTAGALLFGIGI